jgi:hypothetical protein
LCFKKKYDIIQIRKKIMKKLLSMIASAVLTLGLLGGCGGGNSVLGTSSSSLAASSSEQTTPKHKLHIATTTGI